MVHVFQRLADAARSLAAAASYEAAVEVVALRWRVPAAELRRRCQRRPDYVNLKRQALYLAVMRGHSRRRIAEITGLSHEAVARACRTIEEARDDPQLDRLLDELELEAKGI
jgi:hypothetical protein